MLEDSYRWQSSASFAPYSPQKIRIQDNARHKAEIAAARRKLDASNENAVHIPESLRTGTPAPRGTGRALYM